MAYEGPEYWYVIYKAVGDFGSLMKDAAEAKAALQGMADAAKAESAAEIAGSTQAASARQKDIASIQQETQALSQLAQAAKATNTQLAYGGRNDMTAHLSDLAQELNYTTLLNRQKWLGFSSVQQAMSYRQQMYNLALLENRAHFAGYQTADQYLGFLQRETAQTAALSAAIRDRSSAISAETQLLLAHTNALQGTHQTAGSLGEQLGAASAFATALTGLPSVVRTRAELDTTPAMAELAAYRAALSGLPHAERLDIVTAATRLGGVALTGAREKVPVTVQPEVDYASASRMLDQAVSQVRPATVQGSVVSSRTAPADQSGLADDQLGLMWERPAGAAEALSEAVRKLQPGLAVSQQTVERFGNSAMLAAVDVQALADGVTRLDAAGSMLLSGRLSPDAPRRMTAGQSEQLMSIERYAQQGWISNQPGGYPRAAPVGLTPVAREPLAIEAPKQQPDPLAGMTGGEDDLWAELSQYRQQPAAAQAASLAGGSEGLGADSGSLGRAAAEAKTLNDELNALPYEKDTILEVTGNGVEEVRDYSRIIASIDREVGTEAYFDADPAERDMDSYLARLMAAIQRHYEFIAGFNDTEALTELSGWMAAVREAQAEQDRISENVAGMGGAAGGGGGGSPPTGNGGDDYGPDPEDDDLWNTLSGAIGRTDEAVRGYEADANRVRDLPHPDDAESWDELSDAEGSAAERAAEAVQQLQAMARASIEAGKAADAARYAWAANVLLAASAKSAGTAAEDEVAHLAELSASANNVKDSAKFAYAAQALLASGLEGIDDPAAKAAQALDTASDSARSFSRWTRLLGTQVPLWSGLFGTTEMIGQVQLWHIALDSIIEVLALWVPAVITAGAGLAGFAAAGYQAGKEIYQQWSDLKTVGSALNETIKPLTTNFQTLQNEVRPQVYQLLGDYLTVASDKAGPFNQLVLQTGDYLDRLGAKITLAMTSGGNGLADFFQAGEKDLALIGKGFDSLGQIILRFIQATAITHIAEDLATVGDAILGVVADIVKLVPAPVLAIALALHGIVLWGGLAFDVVGKVVIGVAGLTSRFSALNSASLAAARALNATDDQLVAISSRSAGVQAVADALGSETTARDVAQLGVNIENTGKSVEQFTIDAGTISAGRLARFSGGLDEAGQHAIALGIASGATDAQLAKVSTSLSGAAAGAEDLEEGAGGAAEAVGGGGGLLATLGKLSPVLGNVYVDVGLVAAALVGLYVFLGTRADATKQFTDQLGEVVQKASMLTVVSATVTSLAQATTALGIAQKTGVGNTAELAASQSDLSGKLTDELTHVGDISKAYGTNFVGALTLLQDAGVSTSQLFTNQNGVWATAQQMVKGLVTGYEAMGQQLGMVGQDLNALALENSSQLASMGKLNTAWDDFTSLVSAAPGAFITYAQGVAQFAKDATAAGASMSGLSANSLTLQSDFQSNYSNVEKFFDAFRNDQAVSGAGNFTQFVKDAVASLIPMAGGSKEAAAQISALAQEAGGPATTNISTLQRWVGSIKDPLAAMYGASNQAAIGVSNLSQDAAALTNTLQSLLQPAMAKAIFDAHGGQQVFEDWSESLAKTGPNSAATIAASKNVVAELLAVTGNSKEAKAQFVGYAEASGLTAQQADKLWAESSTNITANLAKIRKQLADTSTVHDTLVKPGELDTMMSSFKNGTFYELTFLAWIPQVQRGLEIMNHAIGVFFTHDIPEAVGVTAGAFEGAWTGMVNWFSQSVPHGLELAWTTVSTFFDQAFTHDIPAAWNRAWADTVSPVAHAVDDVKTYVSSNFDKWWSTHGEAVEAVWNAVWSQIRGDALAAWGFIESDAKTAWHIVTDVFDNSVTKQVWAGFTSAASAAWGLVVAGARGTWSNIEAVFKAGWDIVVAVGKAAWDLLWSFVGADAKGAADGVVGVFKAAWDIVVAAGKIVWDTLVLIIDEFLDIVTGHWETAWKDLQSYAVQVWNAIKTAGIQVWNALSTAAAQIWNAIWNAVKTGGTQAWNALRTGGEQAWTAIWHSLDTTVIQPMERFFTSTIPSWWNSLAGKWRSMWTTAWGDFNKDILTPVERWFTSTLPNVMWNSLKGGIDDVIKGINKVIGFINAVTSVVGVKIGTISPLAYGGPVQAVSSGSVPGTGDEDGTHIVAMGGEYMLRKPARMALQAKYGPDFLDALNNADTWLGAGSRGNSASQLNSSGSGRYASGGGVLGDIGNWLGDAGSAISGAAGDVWSGITDAAKDVAKFGEKAVFDSMWTAAGVPAEKALEALGTPGDLGASWLQDIHNGVESYINAQTSKATAAGGSTLHPTGSGATIQALMQSMAASVGWTGAQWTALNDVEEREAGYNLTATNPGSGAYGLAQFINGAGEYAEYGGNSSTAAGQITAMLNYIKQRYGTPEAAWAHELADGWYASGGPVLAAIKAVTPNAETREAMALGSWLLTKWNPVGYDRKLGEYGPWLIRLASHKGFTQAEAQDPQKAAALMATYYSKGVQQTTAADWKKNPSFSAVRAYGIASTDAGTHWSSPSDALIKEGWADVTAGLGATPAEPTTTAAPSAAAIAAWNSNAAKMRPTWNAAVASWKDVDSLTKKPAAVSAKNWTAWLAQRKLIEADAAAATTTSLPVLDNLADPAKLSMTGFSHMDSGIKKWETAMDAAAVAKAYKPSDARAVSDMLQLENYIAGAAAAWKQVYGTASTPGASSTTTGSGSTSSSGSSTPGVGSGSLLTAGATSIDLDKLIVGGPANIGGNGGNLGFTIASGGNVPSLSDTAGMFSGGMAAGGVVPALTVPGLSMNLQKQLTAATSGQLPRTLSDAGGSRVGLQVDQLTINNPVAEKPSDSITRSSNRLAFLAGRGVI